MKNFTVIRNEILEGSQLSVPARYLLCVLTRYCGQKDTCYPSQETLGKVLGYSDRHIRTLLDELKLSGVVNWERTGFNKSNTYKVAKTFERNYSSDALPKQGNSSTPQLRSKVPLHTGTTVPDNITYIKAKDKTNSVSGEAFENLRKQVREIGIIK